MTAGQVRQWKDLINVSTKAVGAKGQLRGYLRDVRNDAVFHFAFSGRLARAYREFFQADPKVAHNRRAFFSIGDTMNQTRFFFADAAVQRMYCGQEDLQTLFEESEDLIEELHHTLAGFVFGYLKSCKKRCKERRGLICDAPSTPA